MTKAAEYEDWEARVDCSRQYLWPKITLEKRRIGYHGYVVTRFGIVGITIVDDNQEQSYCSKVTILEFAFKGWIYKRRYGNKAFTKHSVITKARRFAYKIWQENK